MTITSLLIRTDQCYSIVVGLPPGERLDDLASLLQLDTKNMDVRQLGIDVIKEQQCINLKFSSSSTAVIPEDKAQIMLAAVSISSFPPLAFERLLNCKLIMFTFERAKIVHSFILVFAVTPILRIVGSPSTQTSP